METAKVDIRKLQMLNDCINRTIEALNQVRLSVHAGGLSHTAPIGLAGAIGNPFLAYPGALNTAFATNPGIGQQLAAAQYAAQFSPQVFGWAQTGLGHTGVNQVGQLGQLGQLGQDWVTDPYNPYVNARIAQTFPFVNWGYSPFAWPTV
jgi:hypothetical protein